MVKSLPVSYTHLITFALMYQDVAKICKVTGCYLERIKFWENREEEMFTSIKEKYWNEEKECFTSGPIRCV